MTIGVVAIQGDYDKHRQVLNKLHTDAVFVKDPKQLNTCDALIIPGGESTTLIKLFKANHLFEAIKEFATQKPVMGTCAGLILLAKKVYNPEQESLQLIDIEVNRNAYGRQIDSFINNVNLSMNSRKDPFEGVFIRAPKITRTGQGVKQLGFLNTEVVLAENSHILVATFHPELTDDSRIHEYFIHKSKILNK